MNLAKIILICSVITVSACGFIEDVVDSSELKSTKAKDVKLEADIIEYNHTDEVEVGAQLRTAKSNTAINFNSGETLKVNQGDQYLLNSAITLGNNDWLNLDRDYEGSISKSEDQIYAITYTDSDSDVTTVSVKSSFAPEFMITNNMIHDGFAKIRWDTEGIIGDLRITTTYSGGRSSGGSSRGVRNTGHYELELKNENGIGTINLQHITYYSNLPGFQESLVTVYNIHSVELNFTGNTQVFENQRGLTQNEMGQESIICEEDEDHYFWVDHVKYSYCD